MPVRPVSRPVSRDGDAGCAPCVLVVTEDPALEDRLAGLIAAAGLSPTRAPTLTSPVAVRTWPDADLVLVGSDAAGAVPPTRRDGVVLVADADLPDGLWQDGVTLGAQHVVLLPDAEPWLLDLLLDLASPPPTAAVVGVIGGRGGAGASTLAAALGTVAARRGLAPMVLDADGLGGGLDLVLGAEADGGLRWRDLCELRSRLQPGLLGEGLPCVDGVRLLSFGRDDDPLEVRPEACRAVLDSARRESDLVVVDLPRRLGAAEEVLVRACAFVLLVVPAEVRAAAAAARVAASLVPLTPQVRVVVRGPAPTGLDPQEIAAMLDLPLAGSVRPEPGLAVALDRGVTPPLRARGPLATLCRRITDEFLVA